MMKHSKVIRKGFGLIFSNLREMCWNTYINAGNNKTFLVWNVPYFLKIYGNRKLQRRYDRSDSRVQRVPRHAFLTNFPTIFGELISRFWSELVNHSRIFGQFKIRRVFYLKFDEFINSLKNIYTMKFTKFRTKNPDQTTSRTKNRAH